MRILLALIVIICLVGVGVALAPTVRDRWNSASASDFSAYVLRDLPYAVRWPARAIRSISGGGASNNG
jgi:hypothetical protein